MPKETKARKKETPNVGLEAAKRAAKARNSSNINKIMEKTMTNTKPNFEKLGSDAAAQGKEGFDAFVKTSTLLAKGTEDIFKTYIALAQTSAEKSAEGVKALLGCKTIYELTETQNKLAQDSFESYVSNVTNLSELTMKVATDSFEPLNATITKTVKKATESVAA